MLARIVTWVGDQICGRSSMEEHRVANAKAPDRYRSAAPICLVSKSGDCPALKAQRGWFESNARHQYGVAAGAELIPARSMRWVRFPVTPPIILVNRPRWMGLTVNQDAAGSNPATRANMQPSSKGRTPLSQSGSAGIDTRWLLHSSSRSSIGGAPGYEPGGMQVRILSGRPVYSV